MKHFVSGAHPEGGWLAQTHGNQSAITCGPTNTPKIVPSL
ncbi:hypothetical protein HMPREF1978_00765 [Actinomyces graevenitzii F0530]|uniref:Uncharacterized protein n=1 Tax=Actinomyces graevenitzii F0530 TaxID=1321817 RepID=U1Q3P4_9ACTO|nr:hypothetical protein HMPREF1978_00765 [Actinomyces graevenitzii F0530]